MFPGDVQVLTHWKKYAFFSSLGKDFAIFQTEMENAARLRVYLSFPAATLTYVSLQWIISIYNAVKNYLPPS